jgi:CBS domain containing-hemolysin-like protein
MLNKMPNDDEPQSGDKPPSSISPSLTQDSRARVGSVSWFKNLLKGKPSNSNSLREVLEDYIEELEESDNDLATENQTEILTNLIRTQGLEVSDVMIPRADIVAIQENADFEQLKKILADKQVSRIPVYKEDLDDVVGAIHIKDILSSLLLDRKFNIVEHIREVPIVSPSMPVMELLHAMRQDKKHMALVIDEFGGIDGLVTINDIIEAIVGDIEDEFDKEEAPQVIEKPDGSLLVDARMDIEDFEEIYGEILTEEEREDIETVGGIAIHLAGHVPSRGESFTHSSGMLLEIVDADARRINRLRIRHLPAKKSRDEV